MPGERQPKMVESSVSPLVTWHWPNTGSFEMENDDHKYHELAEFYDNTDQSAAMSGACLVRRPEGYRPPKPSEAMTSYSVRMPLSVLNAVSDMAETEGKTTGAKLREIVTEYVSKRADGDAHVPVSALLDLIARAEKPG